MIFSYPLRAGQLGRPAPWLAAWLCALCLAGPARAGEASAPAPERNYELQLGVHFNAAWNLEEPFLNHAKLMSDDWVAADGNESTLQPSELRKGGFIRYDGLPQRMPDNATRFISKQIYLGAIGHSDYYAGHYTLEWDGDAYGFVANQPRNLQTRAGNSVRFFIPYNNKVRRRVGFSRVRGDGVKAVRLFRDEHRERIEAGEIWNPDFIDYAKRYDVIRTMDMQATNASPVRSFDDVARPDDANYGSVFDVEWPAAPRYGTPFEILFDLGVTTGAKLWLTIPPMIGAPLHPAHPSLRQDEKRGLVDDEKIAAMAREHGGEILSSKEWARFAKEFVDRLVASDYPPNRRLYLELGNEIWNPGKPSFSLHTNYAAGIGQSVNSKWGVREGYGVLSARWATALEAELAARNLDYSIVYVLASLTNWDDATARAIRGFKYQLNQERADADRIMSRTGVALTTYVKCSEAYGEKVLGASEGENLRKAWEAAIDADREGLKKRLHDFCVDGPAFAKITRASLLRNWRLHRQIAERHGLSIIGAYEGGSHDYPRELLETSGKFRDWWREYHWGPYGADVIRQVNRSIVEEFPGVILSNYVSMGPIGTAPWYDGHYARETDMLRMWDEFARPQ